MINRIDLEEKNQKILALTICAFVSYVPIIAFAKTITSFFVGEGFKIDTYIMYLLFAALLMKSSAIVSKKIKIDVIFVAFTFILAYLTTYMFFLPNSVFMFTSVTDLFSNPFYILFVFSLSGYIFTRYITHYDILNDYMIKASILVVLGSTITYFIRLNSGVEMQYMTFSYNMTVQTIFLIIMFLEKKKILYLLTGLVGFLMIIFAGARGPLISILVVSFIFLIFRKALLLRKITLLTLMILLLGLVSRFFQDILFFLIELSEKVGISSRTLQSILNNTMFYDSGRGDIQEKIINSYTVLGLGLYGDRVASGGSYAHNFFIEVMSQFGYAFGPIVIGVVLVIILNGVLSKNNEIRNLATIFLSTGFIKLLLSGSYLNQEPAFYILLALGVNALCQQKGIKNEDTVVMQYNVAKSSRRHIKKNK